MRRDYPIVLCFLWLLMTGCTNLFGQAVVLQRKGSLGVRLEQRSDAARSSSLPAEKGVLISGVLPAGTADELGVRTGDVLLSVGGSPTNDVQAVVALTQNWRAGQELLLEVWREGQTLQLSGTVRGKPRETSEIAEVIYDAVPFQDGKLRSIIHKPKVDGRVPIVVYLQGFSCGSIDLYYAPDAPERQLVDGLVERGFAVFRVEKPGVGDSEGSLDCADIDYRTEVAAFDAAVGELGRYDFVDQERIFYFGHSLGGVTAPLLAAKHRPKGVAVYGTVFESWYEYMQKVFREQAYVRGDDWIQTEEVSRNAQRFLAGLFLTDKSVEELAADPSIKSQLDNNILGYDGEDRFVGRHYTFWRGINAANPVQAWREAGVHTLAIYGEHDLHAISRDGTQKIAEMVNEYHPGKGKFVLLEGTEHAFAKVSSMAEYVRLRRSGAFDNQYMAEHFNPELVRIVADWMEEVIRADAKEVGRN